MATVFFKVSDQQETEIKKFMKQEGYSSKAEFFRFLLKFFKYQKSPEDIRFEKAAKELGDVVDKLAEQGKLNKSIEEQLKDV